MNHKSIQRLSKAVKRTSAAASGPRIKVVIKGRLNAAHEVLTYLDADGQRRRLGFGHFAAFPFQIDLIEVQRIGSAIRQKAGEK